MDAILQWKRAARAGEKLDAPRLVKEIPSAAVRTGSDTTVQFVMSTASVDRAGDTVAVTGWKLDAYRKNPVILFGHDSRSLPVGKSLREWQGSGALMCEVQFCSRDEYEFGWRVGQLVRAGFLNAGSVGFRPLAYQFNEERGSDGWSPACDFLEQELLEYSVVPVPANPEALVAGKAAGLDMGPIVGWAEGVLSTARGKGLWLPEHALVESLRPQAEAAWKALAPVAVQVPAALKAEEEPAKDDGEEEDPEEEPMPPVVCKECQKACDAGDKYCRECGASLMSEEAVKAALAAVLRDLT